MPEPKFEDRPVAERVIGILSAIVLVCVGILFFPLQLRAASIEGDPLLGPETEEFFEQVEERLQLLPRGTPMGDDTSAPCDFDGDKDCDDDDHAFFRAIIGTCRGESNYHPLADSDGDGCVIQGDEPSLFGRYDGFDSPGR